MAMAMASVTSSTSLNNTSARCSADSPVPSSSSATPSNTVKFPVSPALWQLPSDNLSTSNEIVHPALTHANLMWFRGSYNAQIFVSEDEPADSVVRRFRKAVMQAGVIPECRRRRFFETPQDIAKRKLQAAQRRNKSRRYTPRPDNSFGEKKEGSGGRANAVEDDDYWGYTEESS